MPSPYNFKIQSSLPVSSYFLGINKESFLEAAEYIKLLPYGRNADKSNLLSLFTDNRGTCGTKHALLKTLATENNYDELKLIVGLYKMNSLNTPEVSETLALYKLDYIPEAHCYLKYNDTILDFTKEYPLDFVKDLLEEIKITPLQITDFKVNYHKNYLTTWLNSPNKTNLSLNDIWQIREQCIQDIASKQRLK